MKELEDHLETICQMIEDENSKFLSLLQKIRQKSEWLNQSPWGLLPTDEERGPVEGMRA
jgi:hypothetical protein